MKLSFTKGLLPVAAAALLGLAVPAQGADDKKAGSAADAQKLRQVSGEVIAVKQVEVRKANLKNTVVMINTTKKNRRLIADLGPVGAEGANVKKGDKIALEGAVIRMRETPVMVAKRVKVGGKVITVDRTAQEKQANASKKS